MAEINLDTIDVEAVNNAYNERLRLSRHEAQTAERAINIVLSDGLDLYLRDGRETVIQNDDRWPKNRYIQVSTTDEFDRHSLIKLMASSIIHKGVRFAFSSLQAASREDDGRTAIRWIEVTFKPVADATGA